MGAENVCAWSEKIGCEKIIFSSSIAPYGPSELEMDEGSMPVPTTAYGSSKLVAEKIHEKWHSKDGLNRQLVIVRPGVVFGHRGWQCYKTHKCGKETLFFLYRQ